MSGPITAGYILAQGTLLLAEHAIREARAMKREYGEVLAQLRAREEALAQDRVAQQAARLERLAALRREADRQLSRIERLRALASAGAATLPAPPSEDSDSAWSGYLQQLETEADSLRRTLAQSGDSAAEALRARLDSHVAPTIDEVLAAYAMQRQRDAALDDSQAARFRETAARVLGRLDLEAGDAVPIELEALAREIVRAPHVERAEALTSELRLAVQRQREARDAQRADAAEARKLLAEMPEDAPVPLLRAIERVAAGVERMDERLRTSAGDVLDTAAIYRAEAGQRAAACVLEESLRDLGYEVEDIDATLFVGGGVAHFRRPGWDNYYVRLRVDPLERTVNFNVVRARGDEDSAERRRLDALAEDRWCAEFPRLVQTLEARGLTLDVTRRLEAGEVPVQVVDGATLPPMHTDADTDTARPRKAPLARRAP